MIKEFWEEQHTNKVTRYLAYTEPKKTLEILGVRYVAPPVLDIGVGDGSFAAYIADKKIEVHCLDISEAALKQVEGKATKIYLSSEIGTLPSNFYNLITCHLVFQHMNNEDMSTYLKYIIQSLTPFGRFAFQTANSLSGKFNTHDDSLLTEEILREGSVLRDADFVKNMINLAGGEVAYHNDSFKYPDWATGFGWDIFHVRRKI